MGRTTKKARTKEPPQKKQSGGLGLLLDHSGCLSSLLLQSNLGSKGAVRLPLSGSARSSLFHHLVNLLKGQTLGLGNEEVGVDKGTGTQRTPDEEHLGTKVTFVGLSHVRSDDCDDAVPEPVGRGGEGNTAGPDGQREDFTDDDPSTGTPSASKEKDVDANECDHRTDSTLVLRIGGDANNGDNELTYNHTQGTPKEQGATSEFLDGVEGDGGREDIDNRSDHADQERIINCLEILEEGGSVVENEVHTSPSIAC